ncbi:DUF2190 family protein [Pannonibacter indicus]|uniref:DUF2190 family protein n=1 Tax=Pannonibacter indicus TaxID=466044 RepID=UPI003918CA31
MRNYLQPGDVLDLIAPTGGIVSGEAHLFGDLFGVAATTAGEGEKVPVKVSGVFMLPKVPANGLSEGQKVYWNEAEKKLTSTASGNTLVGHAVKAVAAGAAYAMIRVSN